MKTMAASKFKEKCLSILDDVEPDGLVITKHGRPVAMLVPYGGPSQKAIGCLRGKFDVVGDVMSTGIRWDAEATEP